MKPVRTERKRVNWLLIKRRDEHSRDADGSAVLVEDRSIASGRTMAAIADGKGRGPKPFILAGKAAADPGAVWDSGTGVAAAKRAVTKSAAGNNRARPKGASVKSSLKLPDFILPQLCVNMERPPNGPGWAHEIKFDGYRVQLHVQDGTVTLKTRKGLDWTAKFGTIAAAASRLSNGIIDGEIVALGVDDAPDFAALQGALSEGKTNDLIFFAFDLLFDGGEDLRQRPLYERKARLQEVLLDQGDRGVMRLSNISRPAEKPCFVRSANFRWKGSYQRSLTHPTGPVAMVIGSRQSAGQVMKWSLADGVRLTENSDRSSWASIAATILFMLAGWVLASGKQRSEHCCRV